jgi:hypothetical protein
MIFVHSAAYRLTGSFNMRGRLKQLFLVLTDDNIGSGPRPEPNSLQDPSTFQPQAELVEQAVENIRQDHMYTSSQGSTPKSSRGLTPKSSQAAASQHSSGSGSKRKSEENASKGGQNKKQVK